MYAYYIYICKFNFFTACMQLRVSDSYMRAYMLCQKNLAQEGLIYLMNRL